jgi:hypothetical protein
MPLTFLEKVGIWAAVAAAAAAFLTLALFAWSEWRGFKVRSDSFKPAYCTYSGISAHAPREQTRLACPRNQEGIGHNFRVAAEDIV